MSESIITGTIANRWSNQSVRVVSVGVGSTIIDEIEVNEDERWSLKVTEAAESIVAHTTGSRLATFTARPQENMEVVFPELVQLDLHFEGLDGPAVLWLDPLRVQGFPNELLWALRAHPDNIVDLHLVALQLPGAGNKLEIQRGRYGLSGGRFAISDEIINTNLRLASGLDQTTGTLFDARDGVIEVDILQPSTLMLTFGPLE